MEFRELKYFLTLCEMGSITAAADALNITQPALSRQMIGLEEELGEKLFVREKRGVILTEAGCYLKKRALDIIGLVDRTAAEIPRTNSTITGELHICAGESPSIRYTVQVIKKLRGLYPGIRIHFFNGGSRDIQTEWLENGVIDFSLMGVVPLTKRFANIKLPLQDNWGLLMRKDDALASKPAVNPGDLMDLPILTGKSENFQSLMSGWLGYDFNQLNVVGSSFLMTSTEHMVKERLAYAIIKEGIMNEGLSSELCFRPFAPEVKSSVFLVWANSRPFSRAQELFLDAMKAQIGE